jgi:hypothetical protein
VSLRDELGSVLLEEDPYALRRRWRAPDPIENGAPTAMGSLCGGGRLGLLHGVYGTGPSRDDRVSGDITDARDAVEEAIYGWNHANARNKQIILQLWRWETSAFRSSAGILKG